MWKCLLLIIASDVLNCYPMLSNSCHPCPPVDVIWCVMVDKREDYQNWPIMAQAGSITTHSLIRMWQCELIDIYLHSMTVWWSSHKEVTKWHHSVNFFKIWKIRDILFVGNSILNTSCVIDYDDYTVTSVIESMPQETAFCYSLSVAKTI